MIVITTVLAGMNLALFYENIGGITKNKTNYLVLETELTAVFLNRVFYNYPPNPHTPPTPQTTSQDNEWADLKRWVMIVIATVLAGMNLALFYENIGGKPKSN
jgi:hypothetical protein